MFQAMKYKNCSSGHCCPHHRNFILAKHNYEKKSLADEKCSIDEVFKFVAGKSVPWNDAFRIGRKKPAEDSCEDRRPRPLLVKLGKSA